MSATEQRELGDVSRETFWRLQDGYLLDWQERSGWNFHKFKKMAQRRVNWGQRLGLLSLKNKESAPRSQKGRQESRCLWQWRHTSRGHHVKGLLKLSLLIGGLNPGPQAGDPIELEHTNHMHEE